MSRCLAATSWSGGLRGAAGFAFLLPAGVLSVPSTPRPENEALTEPLDLAERDCFIGVSLTTAPRYEWRVNGELVR